MKSCASVNEGEALFKTWLDGRGLFYLPICSAEDRMPVAFKEKAKRPDFIISLKGGLIAVDVKRRRNDRGPFEIDSTGHRLGIGFEHRFKIPLWYAFLHRKSPEVTWLWARASTSPLPVAGLKKICFRRSFLICGDGPLGSDLSTSSASPAA